MFTFLIIFVSVLALLLCCFITCMTLRRFQHILFWKRRDKGMEQVFDTAAAPAKLSLVGQQLPPDYTQPVDPDYQMKMITPVYATPVQASRIRVALDECSPSRRYEPQQTPPLFQLKQPPSGIEYHGGVPSPSASKDTIFYDARSKTATIETRVRFE